MSKIKLQFEGTEREFELLPFRDQSPATHYIADGDIRECGYDEMYNTPLRLIRPRHEFGGVVYEETGGVRNPLIGEYVLNFGRLEYYVGGNSHAEMVILKAVTEGT